MKRILFLILPLLVFITHIGYAASSMSLTDVSLNYLRTHPQQPHIWVAANPQQLFTSKDSGTTWVENYRLPSEALLNDIDFLPHSSHQLLLCTSKGLYTLDVETQQIAQANIKATDCQKLSVAQRKIVIASTSNLWIATPTSAWKNLKLPNSSQTWFDVLLADPNTLYALSTTHLFKGNLDQQQWKTLPITFTEETLDGKESNDSRRSGEEDSDSLALLRGLYIHPSQPQTLYVYSQQGIRMSVDAGEHWQWLPLIGLPSKGITDLVHHQGALVASTLRGVYRLQQDHWQPINTLPMIATQALNSHAGQLIALTNKGWHVQKTAASIQLSAIPNFETEPSVQALQKAAMHYAEVHPDKIQRWRKQARFKALLPSISLGYDRTQNTYVTSRGSSSDSTTDRLIFADDPSSGWDVSMTWHLEDLIWSSDQTSIDNRSRLSAQLRESILNEVTRLYFERRRLQIRLASPEAYPDTNWEDELRLEELTAQIDALTNNYLSQSLNLTHNQGSPSDV